MPVRLLNSPVLRWPGREQVLVYAKSWAERAGNAHGEIEKIVCHGSIAKGGWGVGSDLDIVIIVDKSDRPFLGRSAAYPVDGIRVPADVAVYTAGEMGSLRAGKSGFVAELDKYSITLFTRQ